ncbi:hypothetical protein [Rhizobium sp. GN54]|uniref:hypothetical protein n=1 Tax=Rhizobium sp. GN54 TaxID=2898150 RepID=UPI001E2EE8A4|nr:hypothetical protein [Rhizobium sp. GN54]MCD2184319.1 hypothetical protein [Rhizobium sp. GN54]
MTNTAAGTPRSEENVLGNAELINRIAENIRIASGTSLPREYYLQQARQQLAGQQPAGKSPPGAAKGQDQKTSACFDAWARR